MRRMFLIGLIMLGIAVCFASFAPKGPVCNEPVVSRTPIHIAVTKAPTDWLIDENFDAGSDLPTGWISIDGDADGETWVIYEYDDAHSAPNIVGCTYNSAGNDDWLITSQFNVETGFAIDCWYVSYNPSYLETMDILVSTGTATPADFTDIIHHHEEIPAEWQNIVIPLDAYVGDDIYIAFHNISVDEHYLFVDDVRIGTLPGHEIAIVEDEELSLFFDPGDGFTPEVQVTNNGALSEDFDVYCYILHGTDTLYSESAAIAGLASGDNITASFSEYTLDGTDWIYDVSFYADVTDDAEPANNSYGYNIFTYTTERQVFFQEFTANPCYYCPRASVGLHNVKLDMGDEVIMASYHSTDYFGADPFYFAELEALSDYYESYSYPNIIVNGGLAEVGGGWPPESLYGYNQYVSAIEYVSEFKTAYAIDMDVSNVTTSGCDIMVTATRNGEIAAGADLRLRYAFVETDIAFEWGEEIVLDSIYDIVRDLIAGSDGVILTGDVEETDNQSVTFDPAWILEHCFIVAYIQNDNTHEIYNAVEKHVYDTTSILERDMKPGVISLKCAPNPFNAVCQIGYSVPSAGEIILMDIVGKTILSVPVSGIGEFTWHADDVPSGIYLARLSTERGVMQQKIVLMK